MWIAKLNEKIFLFIRGLMEIIVYKDLNNREGGD